MSEESKDTPAILQELRKTREFMEADSKVQIRLVKLQTDVQNYLAFAIALIAILGAIVIAIPQTAALPLSVQVVFFIVAVGCASGGYFTFREALRIRAKMDKLQ